MSPPRGHIEQLQPITLLSVKAFNYPCSLLLKVCCVTLLHFSASKALHTHLSRLTSQAYVRHNFQPALPRSSLTPCLVFDRYSEGFRFSRIPVVNTLGLVILLLPLYLQRCAPFGTIRPLMTMPCYMASGHPDIFFILSVRRGVCTN